MVVVVVVQACEVGTIAPFILWTLFLTKQRGVHMKYYSVCNDVTK
jgi:hypothetical protein